MVNIVTDSTADLGPELARRFNIQVIPLYVYAAGQTYSDGINISTEQLFQSVKDTGQLPKTSAPTVVDFQHYFEGADETVYIGLSSRLSVTQQNALLAKESLPEHRIYLIDTLNLSNGIGLLALRAAELRDQGLSGAEIAVAISELVPNVCTSFVVETLDYLYKGGRCSALQNVMSSLLSIRPVVGMKPDGTLGVKSKIRGSRQKALQSMLDDFCENLPQVNLKRVFIPHTGCEQDAENLKAKLLQAAPISEIIITRAGSVIASHCGPDTIGLMYLLN